MKIVHTIKELKSAVAEIYKTKDIGLVPTMGALHEGHKSLIEKSVNENEFTIVSVFVNPVQFGPNEDYDKYPRTLEKDCILAQETGADIVFAPSPSEMYTDIYFTEKETTLVCPPYTYVNKLCGKSRTGHFDGVCTVVAKLFNLSKCKRAYFGKKDYQQFLIVNKMVEELNFDTEVIPCPIVREEDGLAISSRNVYLSDNERKLAPKISQALNKAEKLYKSGITDSKTLEDTVLFELSEFDVEYVEIVSLDNFHKIDKIVKDGSLILVAARTPENRVRLIDNKELWTNC